MLGTVTDARTRFHLHRVTFCAYYVRHTIHLAPREVSAYWAISVDDFQIAAYARLKPVPPSPTSRSPSKIHLPPPLCVEGRDFQTISRKVDVSYSASLMNCYEYRFSGANNPSVSTAAWNAIASTPYRAAAHALQALGPDSPTCNLGPSDCQALAQRPQKLLKQEGVRCASPLQWRIASCFSRCTQLLPASCCGTSS